MGVNARKSNYLTVGFANAFTEKLIPFPENSSWETFRSFAPNGKVPCLHHHNLIIWDSLAITEYLAENHSGIWPVDSSARAWARSATAEMHSGFNAIRQECGMNCGVRIQLHQMTPELHKDLNRLNELWAEGIDLFGGPFLTGSEFTAVMEFLQERFKQNDSTIFIARDNGIAIGFTQLYPSFSSVSMKRIWIFNDLFVDEKFRNKGVAKLLMNAAEEFAQSTGAVRIALSTQISNSIAQDLYESRGYQKDEDFYHYALSL